MHNEHVSKWNKEINRLITGNDMQRSEIETESLSRGSIKITQCWDWRVSLGQNSLDSIVTVQGTNEEPQS